jgi:hypothetical protein
MRYVRELAAGAALAALICAAPSGAATAATACPVGALSLPGGAEAQAAREALREAPRRYRGIDTSGARVVWAKRATAAGPRGSEVGVACGAEVRRRTVVVELDFPRMAPSASLAEGVVDVSRFRPGFRVWAVVH